MTVFKWHRLRRVRTDPVFSRRRLAEGAALGAVMEVDLRIAADGLVCLHDPDLSGETTGRGPVRVARIADIGSLRMRDDPDAAPVTLAELAAAARAMPGGHLQLDFKDDPSDLTDTHRAGFAAAFAGSGGRVILSGADFGGLCALAATAAGMRVGYDPCEPGGATLTRLRDAASVRAFADDVIRTAPGAAMIYLEYPIVLRAVGFGVDLVGRLGAAGMPVDAYTLNADHPGAVASLAGLRAAGVAQITTDEPDVLGAPTR